MWANMKERFDTWLTKRKGMERLAHVILYRCCSLQSESKNTSGVPMCTLDGSWHPRAQEDSFLREVALGAQQNPFEEIWWGHAESGCFGYIAAGIDAKHSTYKDRLFRCELGPFSPGMAAIVHNDVVAFEVCLALHVQLCCRDWKDTMLDELFWNSRLEMLSIVFTVYKELFLPVLVKSPWWERLKPGKQTQGKRGKCMELVTRLLVGENKESEPSQ